MREFISAANEFFLRERVVSIVKQSKFKVGDRVKVYGAAPEGRYKGVLVGRIEAIDPEENELDIKAWSEETKERFRIIAHPKQCRRIKKKERTRVWSNPWVLSMSSIQSTSSLKEDVRRGVRFERTENWIEFIEVKKK